MLDDLQIDFLPEDQQEGFEDELTNFNPSNTVLYSTDWTVDSIVRLVEKGRLDLDPSFQRRQAWDITHRARFIESLALGIPVPQLVLAENPKNKGSYIVIDGKQRLLAVTQYTSGSCKKGKEHINDNSKFEAFQIRGLSNQRMLNGKYFHELSDRVKAAIEDTVLRTVIIRSVDNEEFLYEAFLRLNQGSKSLSTQELRQAMYPGHFSNWLDDYVCNCQPLQTALKIKKPDARMRDTEIALRFMAFDSMLNGYNGNFKGLLNNYVAKQTEKFKDSEIEENLQVTERFERALLTTMEIFGDNAFRKYDPDKGDFISKFNRTVFDSMSYFFRHKDISQKAIEKKKDVIEAFVTLCQTSEKYIEGIGPQFRSSENTYRRIYLWGNSLEKAIDMNLKQYNITIDDSSNIRVS